MSKISKIVILAALLVLLCAVPAFCADAQRLSVDLDVVEDGRHWSGAKLQDDNWSSKLSLNGTGSVTVTAQEACTPPLTLVAVTTAEPALKAVTRPLGSTAATAGSELVQMTPRSAAPWGI